MSIPRRGLMFVLSSPSGAGKTSLSRALLESDSSLQLSISATTRAKRPGEIDGRHYFFIDDARFQQMVAGSEFLEHATVFGRRYGTPKKPVLDALAQGRDVLFDIDWQGTQQIREVARDDLVSVFILPPTRAELENRLMARAQDTAEIVAERMSRANDEMSHWPEYDYVIVNHDFDVALAQLRHILSAERLKRDRQTGLSAFVRGLMNGR